GTNASNTPSDDYAADVEPPKNYDWMGEILGLLGDVYRFAGHNPPPDSLYHEAADIYKGIIQWDKSEDRSKAITLAIGMMSSNIKPPEAAPETTEDKLRA
ncbi:MAG: hypothetical protein GQ535_12485, partial [Rhodobacteraceae bacterium]|nr:hypothetical protein [Paracoccaceae bacterium]NOR63295.1 hypothetical protein [Paracoccaceae bacterium]